MGLCGSCKHWKTARVYIVTQEYADKQTHPDGSCFWKVGQSEPDLATQVDDAHRWGECRREDAPGALVAATCEHEGIPGELMTAAEFGCVQFEVGGDNDHIVYRTYR